MPSMIVEIIEENHEEEREFTVSEKPLGDDSDIEDIMQGDQMRVRHGLLAFTLLKKFTLSKTLLL